MTDTQYPPSPVPGDADLWPGELPFTAFGQFRMDKLDLRVFDQTVYWVDRFGNPHLVTEMSVEYLTNVIGFLIRFRDSFHRGSRRRLLIQMIGDLLLDRVSGDMIACVRVIT